MSDSFSTLRFHGVDRALLWFARYRERRYSLERSLESGGAPRSSQQRERRQNTFALLLCALRPRDPDVDGYTLHHVWLLVEYQRSGKPQQKLAKEWGFPGWESLKNTMDFTERLLRRRLEVRGLLWQEH